MAVNLDSKKIGSRYENENIEIVNNYQYLGVEVTKHSLNKLATGKMAISLISSNYIKDSKI